MTTSPSPDTSPDTAIAVKQLRKRPVVDTSSAETIGRVRGVRINAARARVTGFVLRGGANGFIPIETVQGIGQDAVTVPSTSVVTEDDELLAADSDAYGSRVLDEDGYDLGKLDDLQMADDGTIVAVVIDGTAHERRLIGIGSFAVIVGRPAQGRATASQAAAPPPPPPPPLPPPSG